jgi:NAD(P)H dehydrogenase (quinone)
MKTLIVYAHPNPKSFNHALLESLTHGLETSGHTVTVVDLYDIGFDPVLRLHDFVKYRKRETDADVLEQQKNVSWADILIFVYPTWWGWMPAILKGYFDRIFSLGFAYRMGSPEPEGLLGDKKVILIRTTALSKKAYTISGVETLIRNLLTFKFKVVCGVKSLEHHVFYEVPSVSNDVREGYLKEVQLIGKCLIIS